MKPSAATVSASSFFSFSFSPNLSHSKRTRFFVTTTTTPPPPPIRSLSLFKSSKHFYSPPLPPLSCSAAITLFSDSSTSNLLVPEKLRQLTTEFQSLPQAADRVRQLLNYAKSLPPLPDSARVDSNRVMGCTTRVWLDAKLDEEGKMRFKADSDSEITRGFLACLVWLMDGTEPEEVMKVKTEELAGLNVSLPGTERSRVNTWHNVLVSMQKRTKRLVAEREGHKAFDAFPSLVVTADEIKANGSYAEAQAKYLLPDENMVQELVRVLKEKEIGVAAHFYMDPEVQGVLTAAKKYWPNIHISDSLVMADRAVNMAKAGCKHIMVLGVDFMSENARAILDQAGFGEVDVYRMSNERIGCTLADAASTPAYMDYLAAAAAESSPSLHVIYINTSLETKAYAHELVPTITCTSSNVLKTVLQAFAQIPDVKVWYGPDTYMGANLAKLFQQMTLMTDEEIAEIHPAHNRDSIKAVLSRLHYFQDGTCIVHHMFGQEVVEKINEMYCDAFLTAHLEVPGEMFSLAMDAKKRGMGVVGSTQNILDFVKDRVKEAMNRNVDDHLQFVLGTESGMVTSIVAAVRELLGSANTSGAKISVEIVFPVSSESVTGTSTEQKSAKIGNMILPVIPGVASGEGCSLHGGCASCPYMKMNTLNSLLKICCDLPANKASLTAYEAARLKSQTPNGKSLAEVGCEPVLHMRHFQATKELPEKLVKRVIQAAGKVGN